MDPFVVPGVTHALADAPRRARVVVEGTVWTGDGVDWVGGPVLEVTLVAGGAQLVLVFLGRRHIAGIEPGRRLVVSGTVGLHRCRRVMLNPQLWLVPERLHETVHLGTVEPAQAAPV